MIMVMMMMMMIAIKIKRFGSFGTKNLKFTKWRQDKLRSLRRPAERNFL